MAGDYLPDTNVVIALLDKERTVMRRLRQAPAVAVPSIVIGELMYGALKSAHVGQNLARLEELIAASSIVPFDLDAARRYGEIKSQLHKTGQLLPDNDLWIAAVAIQHQLTLVTRDKHFSRIRSLSLEAW